MKFTLQTDATLNLVRACTAAQIRVRDHVITSSAILTGEKLVLDWPPRSVATLTPDHLRTVLALEPELILLGTGERQCFPDPSVMDVALGAGVGLEVMDTRAACRTYNVLVQEGRRVAAAVLIEAGARRAPGEDTGNKSIDHQPIVRS